MLSAESSNGTAKAGTDYTAVYETITFKAGETSKTIYIDTKDDSKVESDETFKVSLDIQKQVGKKLGDFKKATKESK